MEPTAMRKLASQTMSAAATTSRDRVRHHRRRAPAIPTPTPTTGHTKLSARRWTATEASKLGMPPARPKSQMPPSRSAAPPKPPSSQRRTRDDVGDRTTASNPIPARIARAKLRGIRARDQSISPSKGRVSARRVTGATYATAAMTTATAPMESTSGRRFRILSQLPARLGQWR